MRKTFWPAAVFLLTQIFSTIIQYTLDKWDTQGTEQKCTN